MIPLETLKTHLDYTIWASHRLVEAASMLTPEELTRDFGTADHHILGTLVHVYAADRIWFARIEGRQQQFIDRERDMLLEVLQNDWPPLLDKWKYWLAGITDLNAVVSYKDLKGNGYQTPLWQIVLHVVNHGTHHRGQVSGFLRALGRVPPPLDLMAYYREIGLTRSAQAPA